MRYGVISDVHGNLAALDVVLSALHGIEVDAYVCAGDLVGYGPQPNECVEAIRRLGAHAVAGNHDLIAIGTLSDDRCERIARNSLRWTREVMDDATREYLAQLPERLELPGGLVVTHGSLGDPQEYVLNSAEAAVQLVRLSELHPSAGILIVGHTHRAFACDGLAATVGPGGWGSVALDGATRWLLNPGAVGQSREARIRARFMVLDLERREAIFHAVRYDVRRTRTLLRREHLPAASVHLAPWRVKKLLRPVISVVRRAQAKVQSP
jgi:predicted phosphodiesterase